VYSGTDYTFPVLFVFPTDAQTRPVQLQVRTQLRLHVQAPRPLSRSNTLSFAWRHSVTARRATVRSLAVRPSSFYSFHMFTNWFPSCVVEENFSSACFFTSYNLIVIFFVATQASCYCLSFVDGVQFEMVTRQPQHLVPLTRHKVCLQKNVCTVPTLHTVPSRRAAVLSLFQTEGQFYTCLSTCGPQGYKWGQFRLRNLLICFNVSHYWDTWHDFYLNYDSISGSISAVVIRMHPSKCL
jgi:hypothetical protein